MEHRWGRRHIMDVAVRFVALPSTIGTGRVVNMSVTGAYMETTVPLRRLSVLFLEPTQTTAPNAKVRRLAASVVRHDARGVGLEWCDSAVERTPGFARLNALASSANTAEARSDVDRNADVEDDPTTMPVDSAPSGATWGYEFEFVD